MERLGLKRKWVTRRKIKNQRFVIFFVCLLLPIVVFEGITLLIEPSIMALCQIRATSIGVSISSTAVKEVMNDIEYKDLVTLERDNNGKIIALQAKVIEMNQLSSQIATKMQELYSQINDAYVKIPIGNFTGNTLLAGRGPNIIVRIIPAGTVSTDFKTEFISTGINQTRHRIYLEIVSKVRVVAPLTTKTIEVVNNVNVAETVLVGDVPNSFYNLEGVDNIVDDSLNLWEE
ncbi:MAG: sporulation protein YunB [Clostridia bacterium]|nr:sporulation protein YunB [Clostridia bacterium]